MPDNVFSACVHWVSTQFKMSSAAVVLQRLYPTVVQHVPVSPERREGKSGLHLKLLRRNWQTDSLSM